MDPSDENLYYNLGRAWFEKGDKKRSQAMLAKAVELNPDHQKAKRLLNKIAQAEAG
jgi:TolA-binding protein